jgi:hypothetical protein
MRNLTSHLTLLVLACSVALPTYSQSTGSKPTPKNYAQKLVDEAMAKYPDVVILAMHAKTANDPNYPIIAWGGPMGNKVRIGKKADEDDMRVINTGKENLEISPNGKHFEVELPLEDASKTTIGALGVVFNYKPGDDKAAYQKKAEQLRDELREQIPSADKLTQAA